MGCTRDVIYSCEAGVKPQEVSPCITHDRELQCQVMLSDSSYCQLWSGAALTQHPSNLQSSKISNSSSKTWWWVWAPLFWSCWQLDVPEHCRLAALMQLSEAACIQGQMWAVLPLEILEAPLYSIFELLKFWCLGQKSQQQPQKNCTAFTCQHHHNWEGKPSRFEK